MPLAEDDDGDEASGFAELGAGSEVFYGGEVVSAKDSEFGVGEGRREAAGIERRRWWLESN
ncbi:hypothetical protein C1H46_032052 [Malus baccata]|uniref:Uncharacterized protein n=1 Tax=Malus baccata TaxID=106549 RepID=A0A540L7I4_MALBA|nr:hypothetical protein C1H46_032052 [Malus baccata]